MTHSGVLAFLACKRPLILSPPTSRAIQNIKCTSLCLVHPELFSLRALSRQLRTESILDCKVIENFSNSTEQLQLFRFSCCIYKVFQYLSQMNIALEVCVKLLLPKYHISASESIIVALILRFLTFLSISSN